jgi:catechol 2,3-dioxygenase-like lactoylglutathione lyase family enzyme
MLGKTDIIAMIPTADTAKARAFYEGLLGLTFVTEDGFALVLNANGIMIRVVKLDKFTPVQYTTLGWNVQEIEKVVASLEKQGIHFERFGFFKQDDLGIWTAPNGDKVAWFKDPDGNTLSVSEHKDWTE